MSLIEVSVPGVDALSGRVSVAASEVRMSLVGLRGRACVDTGDAALSAVLSRFVQFWTGFTEDSASSVDATASSVAAAAVGYQQAESVVVPP